MRQLLRVLFVLGTQNGHGGMLGVINTVFNKKAAGCVGVLNHVL